MDSSTNATVANCSGGGGSAAPRRPHWRHRDRSATAVYLVHPNQFRAVVQQLTGATPPPSHQTAHGHPRGNNNADEAAAAPMAAEAVQSKGSNLEQRTPAQMHNECMTWADEY